MRGTRFLIPAAVVLAASVTAASAQTNGQEPRREDLERIAVQDGLMSQQKLRERAERLRQDEREPATTGGIRAPSTPDFEQRTVTGPAKRRVIE